MKLAKNLLLNTDSYKVSMFKQYRRKAIAELRDLLPEEGKHKLIKDGVSISKEDLLLNDKKFMEGKVARNPTNYKDQWYVAKKYFDNKVADAVIHESTYKDNKFLDAEAIKVLEGFKDTDPYYYDVYCLGNWGVLGNSIFDKNKNEELKNLFNNAYFDALDFLNSEQSYSIRFFKRPIEYGR